MNTRHFDALRKACHAPRGWEMWQMWEDSMVRSLVERGKRTVKELATKLQRTENAILCRIEKRYGQEARDQFAAQNARDKFGGPPHTLIPVDPSLVFNMDWGQNLPKETKMPFRDTPETDTEIFNRVRVDIEQMIHPNTFTSRPVNPERWAYRVTQDENRAIVRHLDAFPWHMGRDCKVYRYGYGTTSYPPLISILGVALTRRGRFPNPDSIKDYGSSG